MTVLHKGLSLFCQYLCVAVLCNMVTITVISSSIAIYLLFKCYWIVILYICWLVYDKDTIETGGRRSKLVREWRMWDHFRDYFPVKLVKTAELPCNRNYIFCSFPHGVIPYGANFSFGCESLKFSKTFHGLTTYTLVTSSIFLFPWLREFMLSLGAVSASAKSIQHVLGNKKGGNCAVIFVGGIPEAFLSEPGKYRFFLKERRGFIRMALKYGAPLVPVISFGENDIYRRFGSSSNGLIERMSIFIFRRLKTILKIPIGRFLWVPYRHPLTVVVGSPVEVDEIPEPTEEDIENIHKLFTTALTKLFEEEKYNYADNPQNTYLEIL